jgi:hypothetical protein
MENIISGAPAAINATTRNNLEIRPPALPLLDPSTLDFTSASPYVNRTKRFIVPVPALPEGGEALIFPEGSPKAGQPMKLQSDGVTPARGIVFFNGTDLAWQAARGDGTGVIIVNDIDRQMADQLARELSELQQLPVTQQLDGIKALLHFAHSKLGITDFFNSNVDAVRDSTSVIDPNNPHYVQVAKKTEHKLAYVADGFSLKGAVDHVYPHGGMVITDGKYTWGIDTQVFLRNFRRKEGGAEHPIASLEEEVRLGRIVTPAHTH